jgi:hypothetical protein
MDSNCGLCTDYGLDKEHRTLSRFSDLYLRLGITSLIINTLYAILLQGIFIMHASFLLFTQE